MELYVLAPLIPETNISPLEAVGKAQKYALAFRTITEFDSINIHSARREMERYTDFFAKVNPDITLVEPIARAVLDILPQSRKYS